MDSLYFGHIAWQLGQRLPISDERCGLANPGTDLPELQSLGFEHFCLADRSLVAMIVSSLQQSLDKASLAPGKLDAVVVCTSTISSSLPGLQNDLEYELNQVGVSRASLSLLSFGRCGNLVGAMMYSQMLLQQEDIHSVGVIVVDAFIDPHRTRNNQNNTQLMSDGAASCLVTATENEFHLKMVKRYTDLSFGVADLVADTQTRLRAYSAYHKLIQSLKDYVLSQDSSLLEQCDCLITHNMSVDAVRKMADTLGLPRQLLYLDNISRYGHAYCADALINLETYRLAHRDSAKLHRILCLLTGINTHGILGVQLQT